MKQPDQTRGRSGQSGLVRFRVSVECVAINAERVARAIRDLEEVLGVEAVQFTRDDPSAGEERSDAA